MKPFWYDGYKWVATDRDIVPLLSEYFIFHTDHEFALAFLEAVKCGRIKPIKESEKNEARY